MIRSAMILIMLLSGWAAAADASHEIVISTQQMEWLGINLGPVEPAAWVTTDRLPARVVIPPLQERVVSTPSGGLVTALRVGMGDEVKRGDVMALIESPKLVALQREYLQTLTESKLAAAEFKRDAQLFEEGIISERRYLATRGTHSLATATLDERRQALLLSGMDERTVDELAHIRRLSSALEVKAPDNGVVLKGMAVVGQRVEHSDPLFRIAALEPLWLEIRVPLDRLQGVDVGSTVELPCSKGEARVTLIGRDVDPDTQTILVRAEAHETNQCLRPGQFVQVRLRLGGTGERFRVPASAVVRNGNDCVVFVQAPFGFLAMPVQVIGQNEGYAIVTGELKAGESVAVSGLAAIKAAWMGLGGRE
jgi:cobalt-zinc-cadmium efflux system membrane fusion protein